MFEGICCGRVVEVSRHLTFCIGNDGEGCDDGRNGKGKELKSELSLSI